MSNTVTVPADPVGHFLALQEAQKPRLLLFVEPALYKVTAVQGTKRLHLELVAGTEVKARTFTVIGDNIAGCFSTQAQGEHFLSEVARVKQEYGALEEGAQARIGQFDPEPIKPVLRQRTREAAPVTEPLPTTPVAPGARARARAR